MRYRTFTPALLALLLSSACLAAPESSGFDAGARQPKPSGHAAHQARGAKTLMLENAEGASIRLWKPDLTSAPLAAEHGHITLRPTGLGNYHAIVVEQDWGTAKDVLIRYEYMNGKPSGRSPAELTAAVKTEFEIVPDPLPREHARYIAGRPAAFLVRHRGHPAGGVPVTLTTANGTTLQATTDARGRVRFELPDDFAEVKPGRPNNRPAEMQVRSDFQAEGRAYTTILSAQYHVNPRHWQSFGGGVFIALLGMVAGGLTGRRLLKGNGKAEK